MKSVYFVSVAGACTLIAACSNLAHYFTELKTVRVSSLIISPVTV